FSYFCCNILSIPPSLAKIQPYLSKYLAKIFISVSSYFFHRKNCLKINIFFSVIPLFFYYFVVKLHKKVSFAAEKESRKFFSEILLCAASFCIRIELLKNCLAREYLFIHGQDVVLSISYYRDVRAWKKGFSAALTSSR